MDVSLLLVGALLMAVAIGTYVRQSRAWQSQQQESLPRFETDFYRRRHQRRSQISWLLGIVALTIAGGMYLRDPLILGIYWLGVLALLCWIILLAMVDASASHAYFSRIRSHQLAEQAALHREALQKRHLGDEPS